LYYPLKEGIDDIINHDTHVCYSYIGYIHRRSSLSPRHGKAYPYMYKISIKYNTMEGKP